MSDLVCHTILAGLLFQRGDMLKRSRADKQLLLASRGIKVVVAMAGPPDADLTNLLGENYLHWAIPDHKIKDPAAMTAWVDRVVKARWATDGAVLTYCRAGRNRSGMVNALVVMRLLECSPERAIEIVRAGRKNALANPHFVEFILSQDPLLT